MLFQIALALTLAADAGTPAAPPSKIGTVAAVSFPPAIVLDGVPPIPSSVAEKVKRYTDARAAVFQAWDPKKREMLITTRFAETMQVHRVKMPGGAREQLTFFPGPVSREQNAVSYAGAGDAAVVQLDRNGDENFQLFRLDLVTGAADLLTDGQSRNSTPVWNDTGDLFAFSSTQRNGKDFDLYLARPTAREQPRRLAELSGSWEPLDFSPDGKTLLAQEYISATEQHLFLFDAATGQKTAVPGPSAPSRYTKARFSRDGKSLFVLSDRDGRDFVHLLRVDLRTGEALDLTPGLEQEVEQLALSSDGRTVAFLTNDQGFSRLMLLDPKTRKAHQVTGVSRGVILGLEFHKNGRDLGFTVTSHDISGDAFSVDARNDQVTRWTFSELGSIDRSTLSPPEAITFSAADGVPSYGLLYRPPARFQGPRPVLLIHRGGPEAQARPGYLGSSNLYTQELGLAVIFLNIRGATGYGRKYTSLDDGLNREGAFADIGAALDWIRTDPKLDASKVVFNGGSYGGLLTLVAAYRYPDRLIGNVDNVGVSNLVTLLESTAPYRRDLRRVEYGDERDPKVRAWMEKTAPVNNADKIRNPLLVIQGKNDPRVPISEAEQIVRTVRKNGVPVWYLVAQDEGHGFQKKSNVEAQLEVAAYFLQRLIEGGPNALK